ncbi:MAG: DeoR family transcriptional regulator [Gracilimonas sp.]|nr:DeoR family transcriptional regulator [Gracilimonas sp.]
MKKLGLNEQQIEAVKFVKNHAQITNAEYQEKFNVARRTATRDLKELVEKGILNSSERKGQGLIMKFELRHDCANCAMVAPE